MAPRSIPEMPTPSSLLSAYASLSTSIMLFRTMFDQIVPIQLRHYIIDAVRFYWKPKSSKLTLVFEEKDGMYSNQMFVATEAFLSTKINPDADRLRITKNVKEHNINVKFSQCEDIVDSFEGILLEWKYVIQEPKQRSGTGAGPWDDLAYGGGIDSFDRSFSPSERKHIELKFEKKHKETVINSYLPWVIKKWKELENQKKVVKLHNLKWHCGVGYDTPDKESVDLDHPSTFDTLAMDSKMKKAIIDDLDLFLRRRDFYRKVGKAWKRGYLLYGPPGTGKSSLIAAMANYLKFDIYDIQLKNVGGDSGLRKLLLGTSNRSILVIEDIDCSTQLPDRKDTTTTTTTASKFTNLVGDSKFSLSGLLNFIDGLWSCCGDERIIIFTTNHKERIDPALLRPGRMDVHIHMSYLTIDGFKILAANYLNIHDHHWRFGEIEELINGTKVTPAEVAEELMKSDDPEAVLEGLVKYLKRKHTQDKAGIDDGEDEVLETKRAKLSHNLNIN